TVSLETGSLATRGLSRSLVDNALPYTTAFVFHLSLLFGGGTQQGFWSDAIVQLASLVLLGMVLLSRNLVHVPRIAILFVCLLVSLPVVQLVPLPPSLWSALPGRDDIA